MCAFRYPHYSVYQEGIPSSSKDEIRFMEILDDQSRYAPTAGEAIVKALRQKGQDKRRIGLDGEMEMGT
jgi:hypothetical protein